MDNMQFFMLIGALIALFSSVNYLMLRSFLKLDADLKEVSDNLRSINDKMDDSTQRIEKLLRQIHGN